MDVGKLLRIKGMVDEAAAIEALGRSRENAVVDSWRRIRAEVRDALDDDDLAAEFDRLFPEGFNLRSSGAQAESERARIAERRLRELSGWLDGQVHALTLDQAIEAEARARAEAELRRPGFK